MICPLNFDCKDAFRILCQLFYLLMFLSFKLLKNLIAVEEGSVSVILILRVMIFYNAKLHKFLRYCKSFNQIKSLDITDARVSKLSREKARNWDRDRHASWLRIYAITRVRDKNFMIFNQAKDIEYWAAFQGRLIYLYRLVLLIPEDKLPV